jgi:GT2 family glycosyltransferase
MAPTSKLPPLVSVVITTRNRLALLPRALESVYAQDYPNLEILVLDDASEDGTSDYVRSQHPDVRLFRFDVNRGLVAARNFLMREAGGEYIVSLDDDAFFLTPESISAVVPRMEAEPGLAVAAFRELRRKEDAHLPAEPEHYTNWFSGCGHCIRKAVLAAAGYYGEYAFRQGEEADLALRLLDRSYTIAFLPAAVVVHEFSPRGRDFRLWHTLGPRNLLLRSWVNEPFPWWLLSTGNSIIKCLIKGMRDGTLPYVLRGFGSAFKALPQVRSMRRPVSSKAMRIYFALRRKRVTDPAQVRQLYESPPTVLSLLLGRRS